MHSRTRNGVLRSLAAIASAVYSLAYAAGGLPKEMDAARASEYRSVLTISLEIDDVRMPDSLRHQCRSWKLPKEDALAFLSRADSISSERLHSSYYSVPCRFRGTFTSEGQVYEFSINGGLHGTLRDVREKDVYLLGCKEKCAKHSPFDMYGSD